MKRFIALVLSLVMALSLCVPAWGEGETVVAKVGDTEYTDLQKAVDVGGTVTLLSDVTMDSALNITKNTVIDGAKGDGTNYTLTFTGDCWGISVDIATSQPAAVDTELTVKNLTIDAKAANRGINLNNSGKLTLTDVVIEGATTGPTYAINMRGSSDNAVVNISNCDITGLIALNVWGENMKITVTDTRLTSVDGNATENYAAVKLNNDGETSAEGTVIDIIGGTITATDEEENPSEALYNATKTGKINVSDPPTDIEGGSMVPVAVIRYENGTSYSNSSLAGLVKKATANDTILLINDVTLTSDVTLPCTIQIDSDITIDLNGYTITNNVQNAPLFEIVDGAKNVTFIGGKMVIPAENTAAEGFVSINTAAKVVIDGGTYSGDTNYNGSDKDSYKHTAFFTNPVDGVDIELKNVTASTNHFVVYADAAYNTMKFTGGSYTSTAVTPLVAAAKGAGENVTFTDVTATSSARAAIEVCGGAGGWMGSGKNTVAVFNDCAFSSTSGDWAGAPNAGVAVSHCADVTINGGTYTGSDNAPTDGKNAVTIYSSGGSVTVKGGTLNGNVNAITSTGTYNVSVLGGMMTGTFKTSGALADKVAISVSGGYFTVDPKDYVADGYGFLTSDKEDYTYKVGKVVATVGTVNYDTLQAAVDAVKNGETINVVVAGQTATVNEAKSFTVTGADATITAGEGYKVLQDGNTYTVKKTYNVTFDANGGTNEYTLAPVVEGKLVLPANPFKAPEGKQFKAWSVDGKEYAVGAEIDVAADVTVVAVWEYLPAVTEDPEVDVIDPVVSTGDKVNTGDATVNNVVTTITSGVDIDHGAITEAAEEAAEENKVVPTKEQAKELNKLPGISGTTVNDVAIVVQTYYDVAIEEVKVDENTDKTTSITVDITPMQQTVATTDTVIENKDDIKVGTNAVKVDDPVPVKITEPVEITLKLPSSCFEVGQKVYITHKASAGTVIYEATVAADYTITFKTTHGFSPFTISTTAADVKASVGTDNYADLQSAVNYMGKDATVTVKAKDQSAVVDFATTFTVKYEGDATKDNTKITAAPGYYLTTKDVTGGVQYTVSRAYGWGGGYGGGSSTSTTDKTVVSADTFDAGIGMYVAMSVMAAAGSAVVIGKKRED